MIRAVAVFTVFVGCGRGGFELHDGHIGIGGDAAPDACTFGSFSVPRDLTELNSTADEFGPWLSNDKLDIYYSSARTVSNFLIYHAHRATPQATFDAPVVVANLAASGNVDDPFITDDGLQMVFENSTSTLLKDQELFIATRTDTSVEFTNGAKLANVNVVNFSDGAASLTSDGLTMIYNSTRAGSFDLYITTRPTTGSAFAAPVALELNTPGFECCSSLSSDGSSMIMVSDASGTQRIAQSVRVAGVYQAPTMLDPVLAGATGNGEVDPTITRDGTTIVFVSNRAGGLGGYDVYIADRSCQ